MRPPPQRTAEERKRRKRGEIENERWLGGGSGVVSGRNKGAPGVGDLLRWYVRTERKMEEACLLVVCWNEHTPNTNKMTGEKISIKNEKISIKNEKISIKNEKISKNEITCFSYYGFLTNKHGDRIRVVAY
jgi:hypothetical protein